VTGRVTSQHGSRLRRRKDAGYRGGRLAAQRVDPHLRLGADVPEPLGAVAESGNHDVAARRWMLDNFQDDMAPGTGLAPGVLEHHEPRSEQDPEPCPVQPDRGAH
jgi:hypothetical protein